MARYFNRTRGPISVRLRSGKAACLMGMSWTDIPAEEESCEDLVRHVRGGDLARFDLSTYADTPVKEDKKPAVEADQVETDKSVQVAPVPAKARKSASEKQEG